MVEVYPFPIQCAVAAGAVCREAACMRVVLGMAGDASGGSALEGFAHMASFASHGHMLASEWKFGQAMIKLYLLFPSGVAMTVLAAIAKLTFMDILRFVAADAGHLKF